MPVVSLYSWWTLLVYIPTYHYTIWWVISRCSGLILVPWKAIEVMIYNHLFWAIYLKLSVFSLLVVIILLRIGREIFVSLIKHENTTRTNIIWHMYFKYWQCHIMFSTFPRQCGGNNSHAVEKKANKCISFHEGSESHWNLNRLKYKPWPCPS